MAFLPSSRTASRTNRAASYSARRRRVGPWSRQSTADIGKVAVAGQPLLNLIPEGSELQADVCFTTRAAGFVGVGTQALLHFQAFSYQKFGGRRSAASAGSSRMAVAGNELPARNGAGQAVLHGAASHSPRRRYRPMARKRGTLQAQHGLRRQFDLDTQPPCSNGFWSRCSASRQVDSLSAFMFETSCIWSFSHKSQCDSATEATMSLASWRWWPAPTAMTPTCRASAPSTRSRLKGATLRTNFA